MFEVVALQLIVLHALDGRDVVINPRAVVSLRQARDESHPGKQLTGKVNCIIATTDGKYLTVEESCDSVRQRLEQIGEKP